MKKLIMTKGLPGSGKTWWAKSILDKQPNAYKIICKDDLRAMLDDSEWSRDSEKFILKARDALIELALSQGKHVIVADTNLAEKHEKRLRELAKLHNATFQIQSFLDVPIETCIKQDLKRLNSVGEAVIRKMHNDFIRVQEVYTPDLTLPSAIIVDIDGTLAIKGDRSPFDWDKVNEDTPNIHIKSLVQMYNFHNIRIILMSGRDEICRSKTEKWLEDNDIRYEALFMRPQGNCEKDSIIKRRLFDEYVRNKYNVFFVVDDRQQVVDEWRRMGLMCLQVAEGDF